MQVEELFVMWVGSLIIWFKLNWDVYNLSFKPSVVLLSLEYQLAHLALKLPNKIVSKGLEKDTASTLDSKFSKMYEILFGFDSEIYIGKLICKCSSQ